MQDYTLHCYHHHHRDDNDDGDDDNGDYMDCFHPENVRANYRVSWVNLQRVEFKK